MALLRASNIAQRPDSRYAAFLSHRPEMATQAVIVANELPSEAQQGNLSETALPDTRLLERSWQTESWPDRRQGRGSQARQPGEQQMSESSRQRSVLIIDDDDDNLLFAQYAVEYLGHRATSIKSGQGAVAIAMTCFPDIILLDILLKNVNGIDVLRQLRQQESIAHVPVVAVTALARPSDHKNIMAAGFSDYLLKPYMIDELERTINRHLPA